MVEGRWLRRSLGLDNFQHIWIQKIINYPTQVFILTYDSRYPNTYIAYAKVKKLKSTTISQIKRIGYEGVEHKNFKLTPPIQLWDADINMKADSMIIMRDLAGEYLRDEKMFTEESLYTIKEKEVVIDGKDTKLFIRLMGQGN